MAVAKGRFQLYPKIDPPLKAGSYRFTTRQQLAASGPHGALDSDALGVEELTTHIRVRSPQYLLPPDQVLSTFPPADREGSFGSRLPQVVIKRRTLPWERQVDEAHPDEPWLALVLVAEGEAELKLNQKVGDCVTPGVHLDPPADVEQGNYLSVRESVVQRVFPTREEVRLLAHAREVDVSDTELMMGDDDGFLAVVISNRLPLPARDAAGAEAPVKYLACLVNLCGQWDRLLDKAPVSRVSTSVPALVDTTAYTLSEVDHARMQVAHLQAGGPLPKAAESRTTVSRPSVDPGGAAPFVGASGWAGSAKADDTLEVANIYSRMAAPFALAATAGFVVGDVINVDPQVRFPVLLHWSFTSVGEETFESIMAGLDSGLLGTAAPTTQGRPPLEVVETGHTGLAHRLRGGDQVRSWYRGPLVPHPTDDDPTKRLPIAHAADQVRSVVPDGREDISLAAAFEIGRMLGLSRPSVVAALLRWRQGGYQTASLQGGFAGAMLGEALAGLEFGVDRLVGGKLGALVAERMVGRPAAVLGDPSPLATAGRAVLEDRDTRDVLSVGLAIDPQVLTGSAGQVLGRLGTLSPGGAQDAVFPATVDGLRSRLAPSVDASFSRAAVQALAPELKDGTLDTGQVTLPIDLQQHLSTALVPDVGVLRQRLDLDIDLAAVPHGADALDLLMQARRQHDERTGPEEDR